MRILCAVCRYLISNSWMSKTNQAEAEMRTYKKRYHETGHCSVRFRYTIYFNLPVNLLSVSIL